MRFWVKFDQKRHISAWGKPKFQCAKAKIYFPKVNFRFPKVKNQLIHEDGCIAQRQML